MKSWKCKYCKENVNKDVRALNLKLINKDISEFMCLTCFADYLDCTEERLQTKIEELKEQGCELFW